MKLKITNLFISIFFFSLNNSFSQSFAVIGDIGSDDSSEFKVSVLVKSWNPEFIISLGDHNYFSATFQNMDRTVGKYYHEYIYPYSGTYGPGSTENRFFPCLGNHDTHEDSGQVYFDYFTLPNNERYYDFVKGNIHFFVVNSSHTEPDGNTDSSIQANWLKTQMMAATEPWKIVYFHRPPFSSDTVYGSFPELRWPFKEWGASAVMTGHAHVYERLMDNGLTYFINGLGGQSKYLFGEPIPQSQHRYSDDFGAMKVNANADSMEFMFYNISDSLIDRYVLKRSSLGIKAPTSTIKLLSLRPNPFLSLTTLSLELSKPTEIKIEIINIMGQIIYSGTNNYSPGSHSIPLNTQISPGVYYFKISSKNDVIVKRVIKL